MQLGRFVFRARQRRRRRFLFDRLALGQHHLQALEVIDGLGQLEIVLAAELERLAVFQQRQRALLLGQACRLVLASGRRLLAFGHQVALQIRFAHAQRIEQVAVRRFVHPQIGLHARGLDRPPFRRVIARRGQLDRRVGRQLAQRLHRTLAERAAAHHDRALVILQRAGDDFRGRCRAAIDQHHHRHGLEPGRQPGQRIATLGIEFAPAVERLVRIGQLPFGADDDLIGLGQERRRDADRARQQAARIVAQVEHQALDVGLFGVQFFGLFGQLVEGVFLELADAQPGVAGLDHLGLDADDLDFAAVQRHDPRLVVAGPGNGERDLAADLAAHALDGVVGRHIAHGDIVDPGDQVARLDAGPERGRVLDRRDDLDVAVFVRDFNAHADELALHRFAHVAKRFLVEVHGVRVERGHHAADGFGEQFLVFDRLDVVGLDQAIHIGQLAQLVQWQRRGGAGFLCIGGQLERRRHTQHHPHANQPEPLCFHAHVYPVVT